MNGLRDHFYRFLVLLCPFMSCSRCWHPSSLSTWSLIDVRKSGQEEVQGILMKPKLLSGNTTTFEHKVKTLCFSLLLWSITRSIFNALPSIGCTNLVGVGHKREIKLWPKSPQWNIQFTQKTNYWLTLFYKPHFRYICNLILHNGFLKIGNMIKW